MAENSIRGFIAIEISDDIRKGLGELIEKLRNSQDRVNWLNPHNIHLTLKFLGYIPENDIRNIESAISETAKNLTAFNVIVKGTGVFPGENSPRVVWAGVYDGGESLTKMSIDLENRLFSMGFPKEERSFTPHITLGRVKYIKDINNFILRLHKYKEDLFGEMTVDSISLIKSVLTQKGPVYERLARCSM